MSRIGKKPITIPKGVTVNIQDAQLEIKGAKGVLKTPIPEGISFKLEGESLVAERSSNDQAALHGLLSKVRDLGLPLIAVTQVDPRDKNTQTRGSRRAR